MSEGTELDRLAERLGIEGQYQDARGHPRAVSDETKRALLSAMGLTVVDGSTVAAALRSVEEEPWRRPLEPVHIALEGEAPPPIPLVLAADEVGQALSWSVEEETGRYHNGTATAADLPCEAVRSIDGRRLERRSLRLPMTLPVGYHRFSLLGAGHDQAVATMSLIVAPARCHMPPALEGEGRAWGVAIQLYGLRSERNWGIGDFTDLADLAELMAPLGIGAIGVNPLHALFIGNPNHVSPYSPTSRQFLNLLYIDVEAIADFSECAAARRRVAALNAEGSLDRLRASPLVDHAGVAAAKLPVLEELYRSFRDEHLAAGDSTRALAFRDFQARGGRALETFALFEALSEHFRPAGAVGHGWGHWPQEFQDPESPAVAAFATTQRDRIGFFQYLQWQADLQLQAASERAARAGMAIGIYRDLALGVDSGGAEFWANQGLFGAGASIGAPPDLFNTRGQNWGLPPIIPHALRQDGYRPLIDVLRANMRHTGALRIDHILGFLRLFWIPEGVSPADGGYVRYPLSEILAILALESRRNRCLVIGEDLGTVPEGLVDRLRNGGVLSYRLLYFEQDGGGDFLPPDSYPPLALVAVSTHDLPTLPGYWRGHDIDLRARLDLFASEQAREEARSMRERDRHRLLAALRRQGLLPAEAGQARATLPVLSQDLVEAIYLYLAGTPSKLLMVLLEDVLGEVEQTNLPGTVDEHPNWRRKLPLGIAEIGADARLRSLAAAVGSLRPRRPGNQEGTG